MKKTPPPLPPPPQKNGFKHYIPDMLLCILLITLSAFITFHNLGAGIADFPQTAYYANELTYIDFGQAVQFQGAVYLLGGSPRAEGFRLYAWDGGEATELLHEEKNDDLRFVWTSFMFSSTTRYIIIETIEPDIAGLSILEMVFFGNGGKFIEPAFYIPEDAASMFDEPWLVNLDPSTMSEMNWDEIAHAVTAYDFIHGQKPREWTHPPLGKSIIALGIKAFGMTPFGWRFMSALFGVLVIIPIYVFGRRMFGFRRLAFLVSFVFTFDFMRYVQSRVATLDMILVTFIICMYLFMYEYIRTSPEKRCGPKPLAYLALSGAFMGLAISVKWTGVFAGLGLGVLFALAWFESRKHYGSRKGKGSFNQDFTKTVLWCVLFFVAVPIAIYCLSYIPFSRASGLRWPGGIISNQANMLGFHTTLDRSAEYESRWWTWPLSLRPLRYYRHMANGEYKGVRAFGNPALWWGGLLALIWCVKRWIADRDKTARFFCIAWVVQLLPWALISRFSYIYHYFPCVPFLALMMGYFIKTQKEKRQVWFVVGCCALAFVLFAAFYPTLSGTFSASIDYITNLQWLPGWDFTAVSP